MQILHTSLALPDTASTGVANGGGSGGSADDLSSAEAAEPPDESGSSGSPKSVSSLAAVVPDRPRTPLSFLGLASRRSRPSLASLRCRHSSSHSRSNSSNLLPTLSTLFQPANPSSASAALALQLALPPPPTTGKRPRSTTPPLPLHGILSPSLTAGALANDAPPVTKPTFERADSTSSNASSLGGRPRKVVRFGSVEPDEEDEDAGDGGPEVVQATEVWMTYSSEVYDRRPIEPTAPSDSLCLPAREGQCSWIRCFEREKARKALRLKAIKAGLCPRAAAGSVSKQLPIVPRVDTANARATPIAPLSVVTGIPVPISSEDGKSLSTMDKDMADAVVTAIVLPVPSEGSCTPSPHGSMSDEEKVFMVPHPMGHWLPPTPPPSDSDAGDEPPHPPAMVTVWTEEPMVLEEPVPEQGEEEDEVVDVDVDEEEGEEGVEIQVDDEEEEEAQEEVENEEPVDDDQAEVDVIVVEDHHMLVDEPSAIEPAEDSFHDDLSINASEERKPSPRPSPRVSPGTSPRVSPRASPMLTATVLPSAPEPLCVDGSVLGKEKKKKSGMCAMGKFTRDDLFSNCDVLGGF